MIWQLLCVIRDALVAVAAVGSKLKRVAEGRSEREGQSEWEAKRKLARGFNYASDDDGICNLHAMREGW